MKPKNLSQNSEKIFKSKNDVLKLKKIKLIEVLLVLKLEINITIINYNF